MKADQTHSSNSQNLLDQADALYQRGQGDDAVDLLLEALRHFESDRAIIYRLAEILIESGHYQDAHEILHKVPYNVSDIRQQELLGYCKAGLKQFHAADTLADRILKSSRNSAAALNLKGLSAVRRGDLADAEILFERAIAADPASGDAFMHLGKLHWQSEPDVALNLFEKGFLLSPTVNDTVTSYHSAIGALQQFERSVPIFRNAVRLFPQNKRLRFLLIDVYLQLSRYRSAMREIETAIVMFGADNGLLPPALKVRERLGFLTLNGQAGKQGSVSLCMITKNEEGVLAACLHSAKPLVDEIIIVDTGSTDKTKAIATVFGAKVYEFAWTDDFSEARNQSIAKAAGKWILIMDADEVISQQDADTFLALVNQTSADLTAYSITTRNYTHRNNLVGWQANDGRYRAEEAGTGWYPSEKVRLFPNVPGICFQYPVHELVDPSLKDKGVKIRPCEIPIHHYGKLNLETNNDKARAYFEIGFKKLDLMGDSPIALRELAIQAANLDKFNEAIDLWLRFIRLKPESAEAYINLVSAYLNTGNFQEARVAAEKAVALAPRVKEAQYNYAMSELFVGNANGTIDLLERLIEQFPDYLAAQFMLTAAFGCAGKTKKALAGFEHLKRTSIAPALPLACQEIAQRLTAAGRHVLVANFLENARQCVDLSEKTSTLLTQNRNSSEK